MNAVYYWLLQRVNDRDELKRLMAGTPEATRPTEVTQDEVKAELDTFASFMAASNQ